MGACLRSFPHLSCVVLYTENYIMVENIPHTTLQEFIRLSVNERSEILHKKGILLDSDTEKGDAVELYFFGGFFAEEVLNAVTREIKEVIPFRSGYRIGLLRELNRKPSKVTTIVG